MIVCQDDIIQAEDLQFAPSASRKDGAPPPEELPVGNLLGLVPDASLELATLEEEAIQEALRRCRGNRKEAADMLGTSRFALRRRLAQADVDIPESPD